MMIYNLPYSIVFRFEQYLLFFFCQAFITMFGDFVQDAVDAVVFSFFVLVIFHVIHVRDFLFVLDSHGLLPEWAAVA